MNKTLKHMFYSLALSAVLCSTPGMATDTEPVVPEQPAAGGGMVDVTNNAAALITPDDMVTIQKILTLLKGVDDQVKAAKASGNPNPDVATIIDAVFAKDGLGDQGVDIITAIVTKINGLVQNSDNPKLAGCKTGCAKCAAGTNASAKELHKLLPLVQKYYNFFNNEINRDKKTEVQVIQDLIDYGLVTDLHSLLKVTKRHTKNVQKAKARMAAKAERAGAQRKGPVVAPAAEGGKGKEEEKK